MSLLESTAPLSHEDAGAAAASASRAARLDALLARASEWLNPILVKECRQALKSRQFVITFALLLVCGWLWSIVGIAAIGPNVYYSFSGPEMFYGYFLVLAFPLLVIVPFTAFRSLAGECEDRTFELVSITTLHPRQIVAGKLGSAVVQMLVYFSALAPCLAFTYLLRGIDIVTIAFVLAYVFAASVAFSAAALFLSTLARERHWQIVLSIGLIVALLYGFGGGCVLAHEILRGGVLEFDQSWFWLGHGMGLTAYVTYLAMIFLAAAAQITFTSENRSTPLRVMMLVQFALVAGWIVGLAGAAFHQQSVQLGGAVFAFVLVSGIHWYTMGALMVCESPQLSPRVKRSLPQSFVGRVFLTWFNPGPGTGYLFAVGGLLATALLGLGSLTWLDARGMARFWGGSGAGGPDYRLHIFTLLGTDYVVIYLGVGKLIVGWMRRFLPLGIITGFAVQVLLLLLGTGVPLVIYALYPDRTQTGYTLLQVTNPFWTLVEAIDDNVPSVEIKTALVVISTTAVMVLLLNLPSILREMRYVRVNKPARIAADDAERSGNSR